MKKVNKKTELKVSHDAELQDYIIEATGKSRTSVKSLFAHKQIFVDGKNISQYNFNVKKNQLITINSVGTSYDKSDNKLNNLKIIFEDTDIIVVEKPSGMLSVSTGKGNEITAYSLLRNYVKTESLFNKIFIVHRLDKSTSGLMLFAKNEQAKRILQSNWNSFVQQRKYVAVVCGKVRNESGTIISYLKENAAMQMYASQNAEDAQRAVLYYKVLKSNNWFSLIDVELETGRKNQIRVQMQEMGHSIAGDKKYGGKPSSIGRLALHARTLEFIHPITRERMSFSTKIPKKFLIVFDDKT
ncbi:MAG: RluA family pseudouridine synthase [Prevotellaceae bacterium]|jgi:23S rRNA pseudouridine1911/1915/1917 synthase|nr:RluA family pseudouridine synthase [Prevotellaceae bacterium]